MKKAGYVLFFFMFVFSFVMWTGCGSSSKTVNQGDSASGQQGSDDYDEIEKLLGISRDDSVSQQTAEKAQTREQDDDLIKLLEVDESKKKEKTAAQPADTGDKRVTRLQQKVEDLQKETRKKDMEIADLKAQLMMQKEKSSGSQSDVYRSTGKPAMSSVNSHEASPGYISKYEHGLSLFHDHRYREALEVFEELLATDTSNNYSDNAQYWMGECYYALGRYREAIMAFEKVFTYRYSNKNDYAQFKIGQCYFMLGEQQSARREFQEFLDNYPDSELNQRARDYLAQM